MKSSKNAENCNYCSSSFSKKSESIEKQVLPAS